MKRAYICVAEQSGEGGVVFAETNLAARKIAADEWNDGELAGLSVRRAPGLDQYSDTGRVPASVLICDYGWHWDGCCHCGQYLDDESLRNDGKDPALVVGFDGGQVFCDQSCADAARDQKAQEDAAGQAVLSALIERLHRRFGPVTIVRTHHFTRCRDGLCTTEQAVVDFDFPGQQHGMAALRYEDRIVPGRTSIMPHDLYLVCPRGDVATFEAWAAGLRQEDAT